VRDDGKERSSYMAFMHKLYEPFLRVREKLDDQYLAVSDVLRILEVTRRQLFYWDSKGLKISKKQTLKRSWRKFSVMDVFGFQIVRELLNIGIDIETCKEVINELRKDLCETPYLLYFFAIGEPIFLVADPESKSIRRILGFHELSALYEFRDMSRPVILVPMHYSLRTVLERTNKEDFSIEAFCDSLSMVEGVSRNRVIFWVDGEKIEFSESDIESVEKVMSLDREFKLPEKEMQ